MTYALTRTASEIYTIFYFFCKSEVTERRFIRQVATQVKLNDRFWTAIADFIFVIIMVIFALTRTVSELYAILEIFYETGSDETPISPPRGVTGQIKWQILNGNCRLPICA